METLAQLSDYYKGRGISAEAGYFTCRNAGVCRSACKDFVQPREAFVGSAYEGRCLPRLLFVSLDPATTEPDRSRRTLADVRHWEETECIPDRLLKKGHWYQTHHFAHGILGAISEKCGRQPPAFCDVHRYFAHTNSAKCKDAEAGTGEEKAILFANCREFIRGEIETLAPDIIVTQGKQARVAVEEAGFSSVDQPLRHLDKYCVRMIAVRGRVAALISTTHPAAARYRKDYEEEKRVAFPWYIETVAALTDCS